MEPHPRILIAGFGTMTGAMAQGWLRAGVPAASLTACGPRDKEVPPGMRFVIGVPDDPFDIVLLGMKPVIVADAAPGLAPAVAEGLVVSVLAGVELTTLAAHFPGARGYVRMMPNLAAAIGKSPVALVGTGLDEGARGRVGGLAAKLGSAHWLADESQFDLVTALAGSGPGFVYRFIDALAASAARLGLDPEQAQRLSVQMVEGAAALAAASSHSPAELARRVASPGGMTQRGLDVLDGDDALLRLLAETLQATHDRAREMAAAARAPD